VSSGQLEVIEPGLAMFRSFANIAFAYGCGEVLVVDTGAPGHAENAVSAARKKTKEPFALIIYTHGHHDHISGTRFFLDDAVSRGHRRPIIWAHEGVASRFRNFVRMAAWEARINTLQFGTYIPKVDVAADDTYTFPDFTYRDSQVIRLAGEPVELHHARGETEDASWVWLPERKAALVGDLIVSSLPNTGNPTKPQRFTLEWAETLEKIAARNPRFVLPGHGPVYRGAALCAALLEDTACALRFIHDEVVRRLNLGQWPVDIVEADIRLPRALAIKPYLRETYGCIPFVVQDVLRSYCGWWSGQPSRLYPPARRQHAEDIVGVCGRNALLSTVRDLLRCGANERAVALAEIVADFDPSDATAKDLYVESIARLAESKSSYIARNLLRGTADDLLRR
jgi:glyoxylase-like metal-dependent hydrolase (beta-lactamase superfamily II)